MDLNIYIYIYSSFNQLYSLSISFIVGCLLLILGIYFLQSILNVGCEK